MTDPGIPGASKAAPKPTVLCRAWPICDLTDAVRQWLGVHSGARRGVYISADLPQTRMPHPEYFLLGLLGAASFELLKLWEYRGKLTKRKFNSLTRSAFFWSIVGGMLLASGFLAWAMNVENEGATIWSIVISGIACRSVIRELTSAKVATSDAHLGALETDAIELRDIFS